MGISLAEARDNRRAVLKAPVVSSKPRTQGAGPAVVG